MTPPNIDGIVATDPFHLHGGVPNADVGWATAPYQVFSLIPGGGMGTPKAAVFIGTKLSGGKPDHVYIGVHVENADQFSPSDIVTLFFDSNGDNTFDFALRFGVGPASGAVSSGSNNNQKPNNTVLYLFQGGTWQNPTTPPETHVKSRIAWNFTGGAGLGIWELEVDVNLTALGVPTSTRLGFGAKLFVVPVNGGPYPFCWPSALSTDASPNDVSPGSDSTVLASNLDKRSIPFDGTFCQGDVQLLNVKSHARGSDDLFYLPKDSDFNGNALPDQFQTAMYAQANFFNTADTGNMSPIGGTNSGRIHLTLIPWGAGPVDPEHSVPLGSFQVEFQQFGTTLPPAGTGLTSWPTTKTDWDAHKNAFLDVKQSNHACLKATLEGFTQNIVNANDIMQVNLQYTTMSTHRDKFLIRAPGTPGGPKENYLLRVRWDNVPKKQVKQADDDDCDYRHHRHKKWQVQFVNAKELGLKPVGKGYYSFQLAPGQQVAAEVEFSGGTMPVPSRAVHVSPRAGGQVLTPPSGEPAVAVPIPAGGMVTIVARGMIGVLPSGETPSVMHNADGFPARQLVEQKFLLASKTTPPWMVTGALIGAFNPDFSDSFFIGTQGTFYATPGEKTLYLAVNDVAGGYGDNTGSGFDLNVVATPPSILPTKLSWPANPTLNLPAIPPPAANLPLLNIDVIKLDERYKAAIPIGYVTYAAYDAHRGDTGKPGVNPQRKKEKHP
jgi:hypothetical protein